MSRRQTANEKNKLKQPTTNQQDEQRYCICQKREDEFTEQDNNDFMIECDGCNGWFHGRCVALADRIADDIEKYFCNQCSIQHGPSIFKQRKNQHRRDYSDSNADEKPTQSGTVDFVQKLKRRVFPSCDSVITKLNGHQLTIDYLVKNGFNRPILISNRDGLELTLPSRTISLNEINESVGADRQIDIIDCEKQATYKMSLEDYIEYFESFERNKIYNVLSLEVSNTKLGEQVTIPRIVRDLSWSTTGVWPETKSKEKSRLKKKGNVLVSSSDSSPSDDEDLQDQDRNHFENFPRPEVAKYCLMSPQSSYTDFHVDFGGSSVWYSVVRGEKIFYLIEPTDENLQKYADWTRSPTESETFLGDCVNNCYKMHLKEENTVLLPAGWIHAVYTVTDSLVFGGNFLHSMAVDMQLRIYEIERFAQVPNKFQFPLFETYHWFAAKWFYNELKKFNETKGVELNATTQRAAESIIHYMNKWLTLDKRLNFDSMNERSLTTSSTYQIRQRNIIPKEINCEKLLKNLAKQLDSAKTRCGSFNNSKPLISIIANPIKSALPTEQRQEIVQINNTKIKVKCRRLPSEPSLNETGKTSKHKPDLSKSEMKLTIKTSLSGCRKPNSSRDTPPTIPKKKNPKSSVGPKVEKNSSSATISEKSPRPVYTLDLEAKRQRIIQNSSNNSTFNEQQSESEDINQQSFELNKSSINADFNDSADDFQETIVGLASFVQSSILDNDSQSPMKETKIKRERSSGDGKTVVPKKSKLSNNVDGAKLMKIPKKIKVEDPEGQKKKSSATTSTSTQSNGNSPIKKPISTSPKKVQSNDRLGKILKIANSIKSRGGILT